MLTTEEVLHPDDLDVIFCQGYNFPPYLGGPMYCGGDELEHIAMSLAALNQQDPSGRWAPAGLLEKLTSN